LKVDILLYIESAASDKDLFFLDMYLPEILAQRLKGALPDSNVYYSVPPSYQGKLSGAPACFVRPGHDDVNFWKEFSPGPDLTISAKFTQIHPFSIL